MRLAQLGLLALISACSLEEFPSFDAGPVRPATDAGLSLSDAGVLDVGMVPVSRCDPIAGLGCEAPLVCKLQDVPTCVAPDLATRPHRARCIPGECAEGFLCVRGTATATVSRCAKLCDLESGTGCDALGEFECLRQLDGTGFGVCEALPARCNPYRQTPCEPELSCQPFLRRTGARELRCLPEGEGGRDRPCGLRIGGCLRGLVCVAEPDGQSARCRQYCELNADCPAPEQCVGRVDEPPFTYCLP